MSARTRRRHLMALLTGAFLSFAAFEPQAQVPAELQRTLEALQSPNANDRINAANALTANWRATLPGLVAALDGYLIADRTPPYSPDEEPAMLPLTDVLRTIVVNNERGITLFRARNTERTIRLLAWLARGENQALRVNATFILANVIDNNFLCLVLRQLRDPTISESGIVNLLQVAASAASYANEENVEATLKTIEDAEGHLGTKSRAIAESLKGRATGSRNTGQQPREGSFCKGYDYSQKP